LYINDTDRSNLVRRGNTIQRSFVVTIIAGHCASLYRVPRSCEQAAVYRAVGRTSSKVRRQTLTDGS